MTWRNIDQVTFFTRQPRADLAWAPTCEGLVTVSSVAGRAPNVTTPAPSPLIQALVHCYPAGFFRAGGGIAGPGVLALVRDGKQMAAVAHAVHIG
ncbi:MAG: hypothetical protein QOE61_2136 [Micromonosporaceae bacterium]|jgi:hypothetical protein|nr:hypothetical protein [Micromonosporaceae bacterium]